ncbi:MAG: pyrimidine 5'-nucleotidase [Alphaproteobacteria bacterium]
MSTASNNSPDPAPANDLKQTETWVFDLDNTLYPVTERLLAHIDTHMGGFIANFLNIDRVEARKVQKSYFRRYGLTLRGLMLHHGLDPVRYFDEMQPIDLTEIDPNPALAGAIAGLNGRKIIYTNASARHAEMVLERLGMAGLFEAIHDIAAADYMPKPALDAYRALCGAYGIDPVRAVMVDDIARNLEPAAEIGMTTVWMRTQAEWARGVDGGDHIDYVTSDLLTWLEGISAEPG